jgi:hypothetical protein
MDWKYKQVPIAKERARIKVDSILLFVHYSLLNQFLLLLIQIRLPIQGLTQTNRLLAMYNYCLFVFCVVCYEHNKNNISL